MNTRNSTIHEIKLGRVDLKSKHASVTKYTITQNYHKKLKPGLVASDDLQPGNGMGK